MTVLAICGGGILALFCVLAAWITIDLIADNVAGAFRDGLEALRDCLRP